jgi:hypothetical protein
MFLCTFLVEGDVVDEKTAVETKKAYQAPVLSVYGDVRQITMNTPHGPNNDNPGKAGKTS